MALIEWNLISPINVVKGDEILNKSTGRIYTVGKRGKPLGWVNWNLITRTDAPTPVSRAKPSCKEGGRKSSNREQCTAAPEVPTDDFINKMISLRGEFVKALYCCAFIHKSFGGFSVDLNSLFAYFVDQFICKACNAEYVNVKGYDILCELKKVSNKSLQKMFLPTLPKTASVIVANKMRNTDDDATNTAQAENIPYDYMFLIQTGKNLSLSVARKDDVKKFFDPKLSTVQVQIPFTHQFFIVHPSEKLSMENIGYTTKRMDLGDIMKGIMNDNVSTMLACLTKNIWDNTTKVVK